MSLLTYLISVSLHKCFGLLVANSDDRKFKAHVLKKNFPDLRKTQTKYSSN